MGETILIIIMAVAIIAGVAVAIKIDSGGNKQEDTKKSDKKEKRELLLCQ